MNARVALVTGASRGIGRAIALALAARGWLVAINYERNAEAAEQTATEAHALAEPLGGGAFTARANIADAAARELMVTTVLQMCGRIDLLVNNAGMAPRRRADLLEVGEASYDEVMAVNLKGPFFLTQLVARAMIELLATGVIARPKIVNIGSMSAYTSSTNRPEYCLSKAGVGMMTQLYADRLAEYGINVYEVRPGIIRTDMTAVVQAKYDAQIAAGLTPIRRWGEPSDVAAAVVALAEDALPFSTGEVLNVDGGFHLHRL
jgi:3-oxoacyl-[acyl-carrier protein] reductase